MIAAFLQLDHGPALVAALPPFLLGLLQDPVRLLVLGTVGARVPLAVADAADFRLAVAALGILATRGVLLHQLRLDPLAALLGRAVEPVLGRELGVLTVPRLLEVRVQQVGDMFQRYVIGRAAPGWHELRVVDRQLEASLQAPVAHAVVALQLG